MMNLRSQWIIENLGHIKYLQSNIIWPRHWLQNLLVNQTHASDCVYINTATCGLRMYGQSKHDAQERDEASGIESVI